MGKNKTQLPAISDEEEARLQALIADDDDDAEATDEELAQARPFVEAFPEIAAAMRRSRGRPPVAQPKQKVTLRLGADVLEKLRASGPGWQSRIEQVLRKDLGL
jgi:uncharacterized protein (DUF4415 family)